MERIIWKYGVPMTDHFALSMPSGAQVLTVQILDGVPQLWALVDPSRPPQQRQFALYGTGWELPHTAQEIGVYVGTFQVSEGKLKLVWHLFDLGEEAV